ncbi:Mediator of RNA polymerase II transcription subunit 14 [Hypsizygus marmoreus]|uniref:Mediator of RNA polymerase II transcription subunit 14 n=1 Tax=Hypsizygus marmoreus TaxID=39966 RepID=A0A369JRG2_HYPMA|nr:Mediator of RNA polymerase II transcription subunit 14 [Hypsizygus marmoreus]
MDSNVQDDVVGTFGVSTLNDNSATTDTLGQSEPTIEELERELPTVYDGQIPLGDLLSRVVQSIYAELAELAETMPNMSDSARKRTLADWVVKTKKQVVKLYAVAKWARDAETVQKCMNITAFLMTQNQQFEGAMEGLKYARESLDPARLRNHDLLTSLDVLTTGSYLRLPTCIKKAIIPVVPLSDDEVSKTLSDMEDIIRYRLRVSELIPVEMSRFRIADGRVSFTVPKMFETSLCLRGAERDDGWFFVHVEFLISVGGDLTGLQEFPRIPTGIMKRHITDEADARLAYYLPIPEDAHPPGVEIPSRPQLPQGVFDAPLVRVYNFLQMMSLSYQLEILWYQAARMRSLGWADYLTVQMSPDRKMMTVSYWIRSAPPQLQGRSRLKLPSLGGTVTISIVETSGPARTPKSRAFARIQHKSKFGNATPSDEVEGLRFQTRWEPAKGALGVNLPVTDSTIPDDALHVDADNLDFESLLRSVIERHARSILKIFQLQLQHGPTRTVFSPPGVVTLVGDALRVHLCADEVVIITIDSRTGRMNLRDTGDLAAAGRGPRFTAISERLNENPTILFDALNRLRHHTITDLAEQKANYLGLQSFRRRNFQNEEMIKLGPSARGTLYIQLSNFPNHYLVLVITDERFRYALITTRVLSESMFSHMVMEDIAWLDFDRIHGEDVVITAYTGRSDVRIGKRKRDSDDAFGREIGMEPDSGFNLETQVLRELYSYCCARVAYMNVERQFKLRGIPFTHVNPTKNTPVTMEMAHIQSSLARSVPALCVQSEHILSGAPAAEAAMPNIRVIPLNWWSEKNAQVATCVKLKYVQQPMGKTAGTSTVIRPSKRIIYDTTQAVVSFLSENVNTCVDEFLEEWARVSKMVVIAREVGQMAKEGTWQDVRLLSFDLQTVEFVYALDYTVSISCEDQLSPMGGNFDLRFSRCRTGLGSSENHDRFNPHDDAEPFLRNILRHGHGRLAPSLHRLVALLRDTLPIVRELEEIRLKGDTEGRTVDTFAKAAGWYRLLYGDLRHALDFRLMSDQRVAILDASHSLFDSTASGSFDALSHDKVDDVLGLRPIPRFAEIVMEVVRDAISHGTLQPGKVAVVDVGIVCDTSTVSELGRAIHTKVMQRFPNQS